jgi:hypothetical protein
MTSWECYENKWFYMKYIGKMAETESLLSTWCTSRDQLKIWKTKLGGSILLVASAIYTNLPYTDCNLQYTPHQHLVYGGGAEEESQLSLSCQFYENWNYYCYMSFHFQTIIEWAVIYATLCHKRTSVTCNRVFGFSYLRLFLQQINDYHNITEICRNCCINN